MNQVIVIKRDRKASATYFALTLALLGIAGFVAYAGNASVAATLGIVGLPALYSTTRNTLRNPPLLRADAAGLWFGGGRTVGWREVKMIGEGLTNNSGGGSSVAVHFHQRKTLLRLPFSRVLGSFGSVGDIDVSTSSEAQYPRVIAAG